MMSADRIAVRTLKAGLPGLEPMLRGNIITLRCDNAAWLFELAAGLLVKNHEGRTLYLHWADYHKRFWTIDYDHIMKLARKEGKDLSEVYFMRAFSRDNNEVEENWRKLSAFARFDLIILDSISELYEERKEGSLPATYSIGKFAQLCIKNGCTGIILDRSRSIHPYLGHISSVILDFAVERDEIRLMLRKHPCMADECLSVPRNSQYKLERWL
ncbi:MAG: hypothetical protein U0R44_01755 [Candidatus Micrarchaeia archaeon]